jgi:Replication-relaxation
MTNDYVTAVTLRDLQRHLTPLDWQVLVLLDSVGYASTTQLERALLPQVHGAARARRVRRRLAALVTASAVHRLDRLVGGHGGGSQQAVYTLDRAGRRVLHPDDTSQRSRRRPQDRGLSFLAHTLAVGDHLVNLIEYVTDRPGTRLVAWVGEPACHVPYRDQGRLATLTPDALAQVQNRSTEIWTMLEVDRGTEGVATLLGKADTYLAYAARHPESPQVVWSFPTARRAAAFREALLRRHRTGGHSQRLAAQLFVITTPAGASAAMAGEEPAS